MNYDVAAVLAALFLIAPATAQTPPAPPAPQPVPAPTPAPTPPIEETQAPENQATNPDQRVTGPLPPTAGQAPAAEPAKPAKWDVSAPPGMATRQIRIDTDEGSWMNVDVSPDGRTIAFDLLGDIYVMPIAGGTPRRIAEGLAYDQQARFSPDGRRIAFVSDRGGGDNIWLMNADGSDKKPLTKEEFRLLNQPSWSPDGRFITAKKHFTTGRSLGTGEVWLYHVSGGGGVLLVKRPSEQHQKELGEPIYAPDGKSIYFTRNVTPGAIFQYAQDSNTDLFDIQRYDLDSGEVTTVVSGAGGSVRPTPSPDGKMIAFVRRERARSKLYVKNLASGEERKIYDALDQDVQETWAVTGVYPNMAWTPDGKSLVFWAGGKIRRVDADGGGASEIPFRIADTRPVIDATHPEVEVAPDRFETRMPRWASVSPDGRQIVFETLGKLWIKPMSGGAPRRLVSGDENEFQLFPSWSRDGRTIVFVGWNDQSLGRIRTVAAGGGAARAVTAQPGHYARPRFSPDGKTIVFEKGGSGGLTSPRWSEEQGIYRIPAAGGTATRVAREGGSPQFGAENDRIFMVVSANNKRQLISTDLSGEAKRTHATGEMVNDFILSPDGRHFAFRQNYQAFVMPLMPGTQDVAVDQKAGPLPVTRASAEGADFINWSGNGSRLHWSMGPTLFSADSAALFASAPGDSVPKFQPPRTGVSISMPVTADKPTGTVAISGARIVTMASRDGGIIDDGVIIVRGDRIAAVGRRGEIPIPAGATVVDATGKTIIPGLVDAHAHGPQGDDDVIPQQNWSAMANLAFGSTTIHDPSARASEIFAAAEMQRAGKILAPRIFSTGEIIYGAKAADVYAEINSLDDALAHVRRLKAQGARSVKNYNQPRREQRQMVVAAAQREGMEVVPEGGSLYNMDLTLIQDGNSTVEHNVPLRVFYDDLVQFWTQTKTNYTPTLVVTYGGPAGDPYWRAHTDVWRHPLLARHAPPSVLAAQNVRREIAPEEDYVDADSARESKKLADRGIQVSIGAHGQQAGLGPHWEMWSFVRGGWSPIEALRAGTIMPATSLGYQRDVGSIEQGKLADLVVLDADPTVDIRNSDKISQVMLGGRLYEAATLNEVATGNRRRQPYWWENGGNAAFSGGATVAASVHSDGD
ncbi:MAG TPA: amidohydrolase family protein [Allosphingosinicella sp.]